ncbi:MAG: DUF362 domain-containing protein [Candidatus Bathyarchaeota archaeon]|nr:MAG: DUF362 domain-containing protein [Candidatus Bathyarchaeota archaeon]
MGISLSSIHSVLKKLEDQISIEKSMKKHHKRVLKRGKFNKGLLLFGVANLLWFIFRTGTKPSRITYPCQQAALVNISTILNASILLSLVAFLAKVEKFVSKRGKALVLIFVVATIMINFHQIGGNLQPAQAPNPNQELRLVLEPRNATMLPASDIYAVNGRTPTPITELLNLMGSQGLHFYRSNSTDLIQGPDGLIAHDDVVLIKINEQWSQRGGTNTDLLKEIIQAIVDHPNGFDGEIIVADNGQGYGGMDHWLYNNAENQSQSTQDVVDMFSPFYNVSTFDWQTIRGTQVQEYSEGDTNDGYVLNGTADPETGIYVSYPKFRTENGTYISFKYGVWNGTGYERRLKVINMPVLKSHRIYGVTASLKNYMGVQSEALGNGHNTVATGGMGTLLVETGVPTLNIVDAIWINANPWPSGMTGPFSNYDWATRTNIVMASTDPVALDFFAAKHVLIQTSELIGYNDTHTLDPDNTVRSGLREAFGVWLNLTKDEIFRGGYNATTDEDHMNVYVYEAPDIMPPIISILSPENRTYAVNTSIPLTFEFDENTSWIGYSLNGQPTTTITGNTTLPQMSDGRHWVVVYANDTSGNMGHSDPVHFTVDTTPPNITNIIQYPQPNSVFPQDEVKVNATVTDELSKVKHVKLNYTSQNGTWILADMDNYFGNDLWNATIPSFPYSTNITYMIIAEDNANNTITTLQMGHEHQYQVIPELPLFLILPLFMATTLLAAIVYRRRRLALSKRIN